MKHNGRIERHRSRKKERKRLTVAMFIATKKSNVGSVRSAQLQLSNEKNWKMFCTL